MSGTGGGNRVVDDDDLGLDELRGGGKGEGKDDLDLNDGDDAGGEDGGDAKGDAARQSVVAGTVVKGDGFDIEIVDDDAGGEGEDAGEDGKAKVDGKKADAGGDGPLGADDEDADLANYSENVRKRVMRERRLKRTAEATMRAEREARIKAETRAFTLAQEHVKLGKEVVADKIKAKTTELEAARESGKTADEVRIQGEIGELQRREQELNRAEDQVKREAAAGPRAVNVLVEEWKGTNRWFGHPNFRAESDLTRFIDREVIADGFKPDSQEYYVELTKRIKDRIPSLAGRLKAAGISAGDPPARKDPPRRQPVSGAGRVRGQPAAAKITNGKVRLNGADLDNMRAFGLDPSNREHLREYATNKLASAST